jgi:hypothetical protein
MSTAEATAPDVAGPVKVCGKPIRHRGAQMGAWGLLVAVCGSAAVAGIYANVLQVHWYVWIGGLHFNIFWLKPWWDGGMGLHLLHGKPWWDRLRHDVRNYGEPAAFVIVGKTIMAKAKYWKDRVPTWRLVLSPPALAVMALALITGAWALQDYALPGAWHALGWHRVTWSVAPHLYDTLLVLGLGFAIGLILHVFWAPAGATIQGDLLRLSVAQSERTGRTPLWVTWPLVPPVVRERWALIAGAWAATEHRSGAVAQGGRALLWVVRSVLVLAVLYLIASGFAFHIWVGTLHHSIPYLAPGH